MKVYISSDIEGTAGIANWNEAEKDHGDYKEFRELMTGEVLAAIAGAVAAGATEIVLKDAHDSGRNILTADLPDCVRIVRGWSGHPLSMVQEIDGSFDALVFTGYHSRAGAEGNPLAHTMNLNIGELRLNGVPASEFHLHGIAAGYYGVPAVFLSGDDGICADAERLNPGIETVATMQGIGRSTFSIAPKLARARIRDGVQRALSGNRAACLMKPPAETAMEVFFTNPVSAYKASFYPGAEHVGNRTVRFVHGDFFEIMRAQKFILAA